MAELLLVADPTLRPGPGLGRQQRLSAIHGRWPTGVMASTVASVLGRNDGECPVSNGFGLSVLTCRAISHE